MAEGRSVRFGVRGTNGHSPYWKAVVTASRPEAYISLARVDFHASLHESAEHWHLKGQVQGRPFETLYNWHRPDEFHPGYTRALNLATTHAVVVDAAPRAARRIAWVPESTPEHWNFFDVFIEAQGADRDDSWPGKSRMGTDFVGRLMLPNGQSLVVVHHSAPAIVSQYRFSVPPAEKQRLMADLADSTKRHRMLFVGTLEDGTTSILLGVAQAAS